MITYLCRARVASGPLDIMKVFLYNNENLYVTTFDAPDAHFNYSSLLSDAQVEKV
jgi:hypothetical protein